MFLFARRYLLSKKSHSVVNIISGVSLLSLMIPVAAVIILLSVFNGFGTLAQSITSAMDGELTISRREGRIFEIDSSKIEALTSIEGIEAVSVIAEQTILIEHEGQQEVVTLRGVDSNYCATLPLQEAIHAGEYEVELGEIDKVIIGSTLAYKLRMMNPTRSELTLYALRRNRISSMLPTAAYTKATAKVSGVFRLDAQSEQGYIITSLRLAQRLMQSPNRATAILVKLNDGAKEEMVRKEIEQIMNGEEFIVRNRYELNPAFYDIVKYEKWGTLLISCMVMLLASFSLIGALSMLIIEKRKDIATLRSMGADTGYIRSIFFSEGMLISMIGITAGVVIGAGFSLVQQHLGLIKIPTATFIIDTYPVELQLLDVVSVIAAAMVIASTISYLVVKQMIKRS